MTTYFTAAAVAAEIKSRLSAILIANGSETDIGRDVMMGRRKMPDERPPCVSVIEGIDDIQDTPGRMPTALIAQQYIIDAYGPCDPDNPNDAAHAMIRDIKRAMFKGNATFDDKVKLVRYMGRDIGPRPDGVALVNAQVMIVVQYVENLSDP